MVPHSAPVHAPAPAYSAEASDGITYFAKLTVCADDKMPVGSGMGDGDLSDDEQSHVLPLTTHLHDRRNVRRLMGDR